MPEPYPVAPPPQESATNTERTAASAAAASTARAQAADTVAEQPPQSSAVAVKPNELLAAAREAFWLHNYDAAEKNYRALAELEPRNPDGYGELGNMYFTQGRWEEAAAAYYEAGIRLVREGHIQTARDLVNVIRGLNGSQAGELEKLITSATTSGIR
jgi:tetratricopeptide (TPR) repeat protein